jgi:hypothetical protein
MHWKQICVLWILLKVIEVHNSFKNLIYINEQSIFFNLLRSFGKPGVEFYGQHTNHDSSVTQLVFLPSEVSRNWNIQ